MIIDQIHIRIDALMKNLPSLLILRENDRSSLRTEFCPHIHNGWELKQLPSGELQLIYPRVPHESFACRPFSCLVDAETIELSMDGNIILHNCPTTQTDFGLAELLPILANTPPESEALKRQLIGAVLESIRALAVKFMDQSPNSTDHYARAIEYLNRNYYKRELSVEDLALHIGTSPQYLNRLFRQHGRDGVRRKLISIRLEMARKLLESGYYLVSDASALTGWRCPYYFSNSFKRHFGVTPERIKK